MSFAWHEIRDHLMHSSSTLSFQRNFDTIRRSRDSVAPFLDPAALFDGLHRRHGGPDEKNLVLSALVAAAQDGGPAADCALTVLLLALWPGLDALRHRSIWRRLGTPDEVSSDILARTTEAIRSLDLGRVNWIAATILRNVERDMMRSRRREAAREAASSDIDVDDMASDQDAQDIVLGYARLHGDICRLVGADATLVMRVAVEGFSQSEVAVELGVSEAAARKRYQRATRRLRDRLPELV